MEDRKHTSELPNRAGLISWPLRALRDLLKAKAGSICVHNKPKCMSIKKSNLFLELCVIKSNKRERSDQSRGNTIRKII